jgi:hypothetical protein
LRQTTEGCQTAGECDPAGKHDLARVDVDQASERDTDQHIEKDVGRTDQKPELLVCQTKVDLDALGHHGEQLRVEEVEHGRENDHRQPVVGDAPRRPRLDGG